MKHMRMGTGILLALLAVAMEARAQVGSPTSRPQFSGTPNLSSSLARLYANQPGAGGPSGTVGTPPANSVGGGAGMGGGMGGAMMMGGMNGMGMGGMIGMGGCCGGIMGMSGMAGGMCGFSGFGGYCGFNGCWGIPPLYGYPYYGMNALPIPPQAYSKWIPSPSKTYYHRTLTIQIAAPGDTALEFVLVHYPDRPKLFYFYDPVEKKYLGRYRVGAGPGDCFSLLEFGERKTNLKDIPESAYQNPTGMPMMPAVIYARPGTSIDPNLQNLTLLRPPEGVPDALLGLPPEEKGLKKLQEED